MTSATSSPSRPRILPEIRPELGRVRPDRGPRLPPRRPADRGVAGDQQASLVGQGCLDGRAGQVHLRHRGLPAGPHGRAGSSPRPDGLITTLAATLGDGPPQYALEGSVFVAGAAVQWFRDGLKAVGAAPEIDRPVLEADPAIGRVFVPALTGLGAPHWEPEARGTIFGLTRATSIADLARATLEGVAFQVADLIDAMNADLPTPLSDLRVDGGMARSDPFLQFQADLLGLPIRRSPQTESTALGAALLAGLGVGLWPDVSAAVELIESASHAFTPGRGRRLEGPGPGALATRRGDGDPALCVEWLCRLE